MCAAGPGRAQQAGAQQAVMPAFVGRMQAQTVLCGAVFIGTSDSMGGAATIRIDANGKIASITPGIASQYSGKDANLTGVVDLSKETCLPGLIDAHTHVLLQGDATMEAYTEQIMKQSAAYRAIVGGVRAGEAMAYGFTTIRDLETEGAGYADVDIKHAIERGFIPGPHMRVATRALNVTGAYPMQGQGYAPEVVVPHGVQVVDGAEEARKAVREQISYGADWIKVYADGRYKLKGDDVLDDVPTFTPEELAAIVDEAHRQGHPVAAHAIGLQGVHNAVVAGVDSVEHGDYIAPADMQMMIAKGIWYVPTLFIGYNIGNARAAESSPVWLRMNVIHDATFRRAVEAGVKIAFGTDAGGFEWSENPAQEFEYMVKDGMTPAQAIRSATQSGAKLLRMDDEVGTLEMGKQADLVAVKGNPLQDVKLLEKVDFVMKGGWIYTPATNAAGVTERWR